MSDDRQLKILHVLRAPVGGLFRHVLDLTREQVARGHRVGLVTDALTGGARAEQVLGELAPSLALGVTRIAMTRNPGPTDFAALRHVTRRIGEMQPDVVHGHGSKGGVYARCGNWLARSSAIVGYTPHGGSFNYKPGSAAHRLYMTIEGALRPLTDVYLFESDFIAGKMRRDVGPTRALQRIVWNGISGTDLLPVEPAPDAHDFLYIGEMRSVKGIDTLLEALAKIRARTSARPTLILVGTGPDEADLKRQTEALGLTDAVTFGGAMNARVAFQRGRIMVVPSRAESLPYVVLEAAGAHVPLVSTNAGGIPEIFGPLGHRLFDHGDADLLAERMFAALEASPETRAREAQELYDYVSAHFTLANMTDKVLGAYRDAIATRDARTSGRPSSPKPGSISFSPKV